MGKDTERGAQAGETSEFWTGTFFGKKLVVHSRGEVAAGGGIARGRHDDDAIVAPKKCPLFSLFSCRRYRF